jgi:hypothetical protein
LRGSTKTNKNTFVDHSVPDVQGRIDGMASAADDYAAIRARMEELRLERERVARRAALNAPEDPVDGRRRRIADELGPRSLPLKGGGGE